MKKTLAILLALVMIAVLVPANAEAVRKSVTYTGESVDATGVSVGGTFQFTLSVSAASGLFSGHWLIDYPEQFISPVSASTPWSGSLTQLINQQWSSGNPTSDKASFVYNLDYVGMTGDVPCGEAGNHYTSVGMYLTTFEHDGVQLGGPFIRVTYRLNSMPEASQLQHDANGYYLPIPITVVESDYFVPGSTIAPGNEYARPHENVNVVTGKVYLNVSSALSGDADANGTVDVLDVLLIMRYSMTLIPASALHLENCDVNGDGLVNITDALIVLRITMGI